MNRNISDVPVLNPDDEMLKYVFPSAETSDAVGNVPYCVDSADETEFSGDFDLSRKISIYR